MMGGDSSDEGDLMDFDFAAPPKKKEESAKPSTAAPVKLELKAAEIAFNKICDLVNKCQLQIHRLTSKVKNSLIVHLSLILVCNETRKYTTAKDLLSKENL